MTGGQPLDGAHAGRAAARGGAVRVAGYLAGQALTVVAIALVFRHLGVVDTGRWVTVLSLVAIVGGLTDLGLTTLAVRERSAGAPSALLGQVLGLRLAATAAGLVVVGAFAVLAGYPRAMVAGVALAGLALLATNAAVSVGVELLVGLRAEAVAAGDLARQAVTALALALGVALGARLVGLFALLIPGALAGFSVVASRVGRLPRPSLVGGGALLRATLPFALAAAASVLFFRVAVVEASVLTSDRQVGLLGASFRIVEVLVAVPALAVSALFPLFSRSRGRLEAAVAPTFEACAVGGGALAVALGLGAPAILAVVAGGDFADAAPVLRLHGLALLASSCAAAPGFALLALGRERSLMWANVAGVGLALGVAAVLVEVDGARGAALATVLGEAGLAVAFCVLLAREGVALPLRTLGLVVAAGGLAALAALVPVPSGAQAALGLAAYGAALAPVLRRARRYAAPA